MDTHKRSAKDEDVDEMRGMAQVHRILRGSLTNLSSWERGWLLFPTKAQWSAFCEDHGIMRGRKMGECYTEPLPDFHFNDEILLLIWTGRTVNSLNVLEASVREFVVYEKEPPDANNICQPLLVGVCELWAIPADARPGLHWVESRASMGLS